MKIKVSKRQLFISFSEFSIRKTKYAIEVNLLLLGEIVIFCIQQYLVDRTSRLLFERYFPISIEIMGAIKFYTKYVHFIRKTIRVKRGQKAVNKGGHYRDQKGTELFI